MYNLAAQGWPLGIRTVLPSFLLRDVSAPQHGLAWHGRWSSNRYLQLLGPEPGPL